MHWIAQAVEALSTESACIRVFLAEVKGSTPRECGASMIVSSSAIAGTIGGGALEFQAIATARRMLSEEHGSALSLHGQALGPSLGQCCGGHVTLGFLPLRPDDAAILAQATTDQMLIASKTGFDLISRADLAAHLPGLSKLRLERIITNGGWVRVQGRKLWAEPITSPAPLLVLFGAGHVGKALITILSGSNYRIDWIDARAEQFPAQTPPNVSPLILPKPVEFAAKIPAGADVLIMTHDHQLDLELCNAALHAGTFRFLGLIGSDTKAARFRKRLAELGHGLDQIERLTCPIGIPGRKVKKPYDVALSTAMQLLSL